MPVLSLHPGIFFQDRFYPAQVGTQFRAFTGLLQPVPVSRKPRSDRLWRYMRPFEVSDAVNNRWFILVFPPK